MQYNISPETLVGMHTESGLVDALLDKEFDVAFLKEKESYHDSKWFFVYS